MSRDKSRLIVVGVVSGVHGVSGEIKIDAGIKGVELAGLVKMAVSSWTHLFIGDTEYAVKALRAHKGVLLAKLYGVESRENAEVLLGRSVEVGKDALPALPEGEYYLYELAGRDVVTEDGILLGTLKNVFSTGSNDVCVVTGDGGVELLIPVIEGVIRKVDAAEGKVVVNLPDGLVEEQEDAKGGKRRRSGNKGRPAGKK